MIDDIIGIKFAPNNDEIVPKLSAVNVISVDTGTNSMTPGTVANIAMGAITDRIHCPTCLKLKQECGGHPGHIKIHTYLVNMLCFDRCMHYLKVICWTCGGVVLNAPGANLNQLASLVTQRRKKGITCENIIRYEGDNPIVCGAVHPIVSENRKDKRGTMVQEIITYDEISKTSKKIKADDLTPMQVAAIFERVTPETLQRLGITDPELNPRNFVNQYLHVPPNSVRPNAVGGVHAMTAKNDINLQYNAILKEQRKVGDSSSQTDERKNVEISKNTSKAYYALNRPLANGGDKPNTSLFSLLSTKKGYIRSAVLGCRVLNVMRHFITGDPEVRLGEVSIPLDMAKKVQMEEIVTPFNRDRLMQYVANGMEHYPRCLSVYVRSSNSFYNTAVRRDIQLENGDIVFRDIIDGDKAAFCRQPTLQISNITTNVIRVDPNGRAFRFNPNETPCYGADYDGDEMNLYINVRETSANEAYGMGSVYQHLISNGYGSPIIGQVQDGLLGLAMLTRDHVRMSLATASRLFDNTGLQPNLPKESMITGRDVLTALFHHLDIQIDFTTDANYYNKNLNAYRTYSETEIRVVIKDGKFISGIIDKKTVGNKIYNNLYHRIFHKYNSKKTIDVIGAMQRVAINYLNLTGTTIHLNDFLVNDEQQANILNSVKSVMAESKLYTENLYNGNLVAPTNKTMEEYFESEQLNILSPSDTFNKCLHDGMDYDNNNLYFFVNSGAKGNANNILRGVVSTGQITVNDQRLKKTLDGRSTHFYARDSTDPRCRGFIINSQFSGFTPADIVNSSYNDRDSVVKKALATAKSGAANRDGMSSTDSMLTNWLRMVMKGPMMRQTLYGGDGMDPRATYRTVSDLIYRTKDELAKIATGAELEQLIMDRDFCRELFINHQLRTDERVGTIGFIPVNIPLIISDVNRLGREEGKGQSSSNNSGQIKSFIDDIARCYFNRHYQGPLPDYARNAVRLFQCYLRYELRSEIINKYSAKQLATLMHLIELNFSNNLEDPGVSVGMRATMALSEINTQQMLDSMHGKTGAKIDSFQDIKNAVITEKMKNPAMEIHFRPEVTEEAIQEFAKNIEILNMNYFVDCCQVFFEHFTKIEHPTYRHEQGMILDHAKLHPFPNDVTNWCIRLQFNLALIINKNIKIEDIYMCLLKNYNLYVHVVYNTLNMENPVMRLYLRQEAINVYKIKNSSHIKAFITDIMNMSIRGVAGIHTAYVRTKNISVIRDDRIVDQRTTYIITEGTNLGAILMCPEVNMQLTSSNSTHEMIKYFGIMAGYNMVVDGLRGSVEGAYYAHYTVFAAEMTSHKFTALNRHGSEKRGTSVCQLIADGSFYNYLKGATISGKTDYITGMNSALIAGTVPKIGTNYVRVGINRQFIQSMNETKKEELDSI